MDDSQLFTYTCDTTSYFTFCNKLSVHLPVNTSRWSQFVILYTN